MLIWLVSEEGRSAVAICFGRLLQLLIRSCLVLCARHRVFRDRVVFLTRKERVCMRRSNAEARGMRRTLINTLLFTAHLTHATVLLTARLRYSRSLRYLSSPVAETRRQLTSTGAVLLSRARRSSHSRHGGGALTAGDAVKFELRTLRRVDWLYRLQGVKFRAWS